MKTLFMLLLFVGIGCNAQNTSDITNKVTEIDSDKDGKVDIRTETFYRGNTKVMLVRSQQNQQGIMTVILRAYFAGGKFVAGESDEDGDGIIESIIAINPETKEFEMFTRLADGKVKPVSSQTMDSIKRQTAVATESMRKIFNNPDMTADEMGDILKQNREKIEEIKKENVGEKN